MKRNRLLVVGAVGLLATLAVSAFYVVSPGKLEVVPPGRVEKVRSPGHERMVVALKEIEHAREDLPYLGERKAQNLRRHLESMPATASIQKQCNVTYGVGMAELELGNEEEAIRLLTRAYQMLPSVPGNPNGDDRVKLIFRVGVAHMRLGETQNCCLLNNPDSCLLPIQGGGVHTNRQGSSEAIRYFKEVLARTKSTGPVQSQPLGLLNLQARWLLNVAYMTLGDYPDLVPREHLIPPRAFESEEPFPRFPNIAGRLGIDTFSLCGGAIADDFDNDGYIDLAVSSFHPSDSLRYFHNDRDGTFSERTEEAGLIGLNGGINLVQADYDNDGNVDILVLRGAWGEKDGRQPNSLIRNRGDGTFEDVTFDAGLGEVHYPTQTASWADYDNDGDLDLYIGNETKEDFQAPCQLFRNNGDGTFTDVAPAAGVTNDRLAKGVIWGDFNADLFPDLYVANLDRPNRLYLNRGDGRFTDVARQLGVIKPLPAFPCWFWDFNNDGALDILSLPYVGDVANTSAAALDLPFPADVLPQLYRGDGKGGFVEVGRQSNLTSPVLPMGSNFGDVDGDGYLDFYLGTGDPDYMNLMPNVMYRNQGGKRFADVTTNGGFGNLQKGHAVTFADFDNDGDQDIFAQMGGFYRGDRYHDSFYENPGFGNRWITVKLVGVRSNRSAIGSHIRVVILENGAERVIYRHVNSGGTFGGNPLRQLIGLGKADKILDLSVKWLTTGNVQIIEDLQLDQCIEIVEGQSSYTVIPLKKLDFSPPSRG